MVRVVFSYGPTCFGLSCAWAELSGTWLAYQSLAFDKTHVFFFFFFFQLVGAVGQLYKSEKKPSDGRGISDYQFRSLIQSWNGSEWHCSACI